MTIDRAVMMFAGFMVLVSLGIGFYASPWWYLLTIFVGVPDPGVGHRLLPFGHDLQETGLSGRRRI